MGPKNFLDLRLPSSLFSSKHASDDAEYKLEAALSVEDQLEGGKHKQVQTQKQQRPKERTQKSFNLLRIPQLLMLGYASEESTRRYEMHKDWARLYSVLMFKIENITIVSGLLLGSSCNLLVVGDLRRMTHASVTASMFGSILSVIFGLLCRINITPARLQFLVHRSRLFYLLYATPSLWGGGSALAFFVAVCAYTWLEESTAQYGWPPRAAAIVMCAGLIFNAVICFILGAGVTYHDAEEGTETAGEEQEAVRTSVEEMTREEVQQLEHAREGERTAFSSEFDERNRRARKALPGGFFGIHEWGSGQSTGDSFPSTFRNQNQRSVIKRPGHKHDRSMTLDDSAVRQLAEPSDVAVAHPARAKVRSQTQW